MDGIDICDLTIEYDSAGYLVRPIDHFDLQVGSGELVLLLGASGSGKTTLLSAPTVGSPTPKPGRCSSARRAVRQASSRSAKRTYSASSNSSRSTWMPMAPR
jgi:ABC-type lipoprotein export system ATPase subunit